MYEDNRFAKGLEWLHRVVGEPAGQVQESLQDVAPDIGRILAEYFGDVYGRSGLDLKSREVATVAALTVLGKLPQLKVHIQAALNVGCTETEIMELLMQMVLYAGFPAALNGVSVAKEVFTERGLSGNRAQQPENKDIQMTWLGFAGFYIVTPGQKKILIDPWVTNNPLCPPEFRDIEDCDYIFLTHAHRDHASDAEMLAKRSGAPVLASWELGQILMKKGVDNIVPINKGGTRHFGDISVTAVHADHSSAFVDGEQLLYGGEPMGYIIRFENGFTIYHAGDTNVFGDMALIAELYQPELAMLPIGDVLTMSPREAAKAAKLLHVKQVIPTHFGGMDFLAGTPDELARHLEGTNVDVCALQPGEVLKM